MSHDYLDDSVYYPTGADADTYYLWAEDIKVTPEMEEVVALVGDGTMSEEEGMLELEKLVRNGQ